MIGRATIKICLSYLAAGLLLTSSYASAEPEEVAVNANHSDAQRDLREQEAQAPIAVERASGSVMIARPGDELGSVRYGRAEGDDQFAVTRFSRTRPIDMTGFSAMGRPSILPLTTSRLTSRFGYRIHPISGQNSHHSGIDLAAPHGTPVAATMDGVVVSAGRMGGYGIIVRVAHGNGIETRYAHLSRVAVSANQRISQGQVIGFVGSTGRSTGPHLHYEVRQNGTPVDPLG